MIEVSFVGDTCFNGVFEEKLKNNNQIFTTEISEYLKNQEFVCCNFEGPETKEINTNKIGTPLKNGNGAVALLANNGISIFTLANNHICDYGRVGLEATIEHISTAKKSYVGAGLTAEDAFRPVIIKKENKSIALIAFSEKEKPLASAKSFGIASINGLRKLSLEIRNLKLQHNWVVLMYHGGEEFSTVPSPKKRDLLKKIASKTGVDAIIAHHSHTFQGVEIVNKKPIFYSLGNFVFDLENHEVFPHTNESSIVTLLFNETGVSYTFFPTVCNSIDGKIQKGSMKFLNEIVSRSNFDDYKMKWRKECYRLVFQRPVHKTLNPEGKSLQGHSAIRLLFSYKFYTQIIRIFSNWKLRNMYFNAIYFKISNGL